MKPDTTEAMVRREFLAVMASTAAVGGTAEYGAREIVRSGELGAVSLCRIKGSDAERSRLRRFMEFVMDGAPAVVSHERASGGESGVWFLGSDGTLRVGEQGMQVWSGDGRSWRQ